MLIEAASAVGKDLSKSEAGIQLSHRTVKEFLQTEKATSLKATKGPCIEMIVNVCIQYLKISFLHVEPGAIRNDTPISAWTSNEYNLFATYLEERPLIFYVLENLPQHLKCLDNDQCEIRALELLSCAKELSKLNYPGEFFFSLWVLLKLPYGMPALPEGLLDRSTQREYLQQNRCFLVSLLDAAVRNHYKIAVRILCAAGILADDDDHNAYTMTVETAAKSAQWEILEYLDQVKWHNRRRTEFVALGRALFIACESGELAAAAMLLNIGAGPNFESNNYRKPIHVAAMKGHKAIMQLLIQNGAECDARDRYGRTSLWWAVESGHEAVVTRLLASEARPDSKDNDGETPLQRAVSRKNGVAIQLFRNAGADMTAVDKPCASYFMVPFGRNPSFVGRESELQYLQDMPWNDPNTPVVVGGLGGMGWVYLSIR